jgi:hypothetical protein
MPAGPTAQDKSWPGHPNRSLMTLTERAEGGERAGLR